MDAVLDQALTAAGKTTFIGRAAQGGKVDAPLPPRAAATPVKPASETFLLRKVGDCAPVKMGKTPAVHRRAACRQANVGVVGAALQPDNEGLVVLRAVGLHQKAALPGSAPGLRHRSGTPYAGLCPTHPRSALMPAIACRHDREFAFAPETTALMVIDMQRDFLDPEGASALAGVDVSRLAAIVPVVKAVLEAARAQGLTIIHTREGHEPGLSDLTPLKRDQYRGSGIGIGDKGPLGRHFVRGEAGHAIIDDLAPEPGEWQVDKPGFGAFFATDLEARLRNRGVARLILTGVTTQCCVHSTLREAVDRGFACLTVADGCATEDAGLHAATLSIIASEGHLFGWVADAASVVEALKPT